MRNLYRTVLDNEESLVRDVDAFLDYVDVANENRRAELFKKWSDRVYTPLQVENINSQFQCLAEHEKQNLSLQPKRAPEKLQSLVVKCCKMQKI